MKKLIALLFFGIFLASFASAVTSQIQIYTYPSHTVHIYILKTGTVYDLYQSFHTQSDYDGFVNVNYTGAEDQIDVKIQIDTYSGTNVLIDRLKAFTAGGLIRIKALKDDVQRDYLPPNLEITNTANSTENNSTNQTISPNPNQKLTASVISTSFLKDSWKYISGGILIALIIGGAIMLFIKKPDLIKFPKKLHHETKEKDDSMKDQIIKINQNQDVSLSRKLEETQAQLKEAQREIAKMKNLEKVREIEKRIAAEKAEIDKLNSGFG